MKRKAFALLTAAVTAASLVSCGQTQPQIVSKNNSAVIRFSWWGNDNRNRYTIEAIKIFESQNQDISVNPEYGEWSGFKEKMDVEIYSNTEADVMQINYDWMHKYCKDGDDFYDLNKLSDYIHLNNFTSSELEYGEFNGKLVGIPTAFNTETFFYNKTIYDHYGLDIPKSWSDIFAAAKVMKSDEVYPLSLTEKTFWLCCNAMNEQAYGRVLFNDNGNFIGTKEDLAIMINFYQDLINQHVSKRASEFDRTDLENSKVAGIVLWISDADHYCKAAQDTGFEITVGDYPVLEGYKNFGWYVKPSNLYAIKKNTSNPEASARLVDFLLNSEDMALKQGTEKGIPISNAAVETLEGRSMLTGLQYRADKKRQKTKNLKAMNPCLENQQAIKIFIDACESVYYQKSDLFAASDNAYKQLYMLFNENS